MELIFKALADQSRRTILDSLHLDDGMTLSALEEKLPDLSRFAVMKHLKILEAANLVVSHKQGRFKYHYLNPIPLTEVANRWLTPISNHQANAIIGLKQKLEFQTNPPKPQKKDK